MEHQDSRRNFCVVYNKWQVQHLCVGGKNINTFEYNAFPTKNSVFFAHMRVFYVES